MVKLLLKTRKLRAEGGARILGRYAHHLVDFILSKTGKLGARQVLLKSVAEKNFLAAYSTINTLMELTSMTKNEIVSKPNKEPTRASQPALTVCGS